MELIIGNKNWSTWSLRPWLVLRHVGQPFTETMIGLRQPDTSEQALRHSPSAKVPALKVDGLVIWDSLAISEFLAERFPEARLWPADPVRRALGRAAAAEMHSGFSALRNECPMDLSGRHEIELSEATQKDIRRIVTLWNDLLARFGGPFLVGEWSIADAFFAPVATRFRTYGVNLADYGDAGAGQAYLERLLDDPHYRDWHDAALAEPRAD